MSHSSSTTKKRVTLRHEKPHVPTTKELHHHRTPLSNEQISRFEKEFSDMIDHTCEGGPADEDNIFQHTYSLQSWCSSFLPSIVPEQDLIKKNSSADASCQHYDFEDSESGEYTFKVLDRRTNRLISEQMPSYHKIGMRLLFSGPLQRELLLTDAIKKRFTRETLRLGKSFDLPDSCKHIPQFVKMYRINLDELLKPSISDYHSFNEFFYRRLKPGARPIDDDDNPNVVVSAADCRLMVFTDVNSATRLWIKGQQFSLGNLFDNESLAKEFDGGSLAIFRLAPVDYHRFHSPVNGKIGTFVKVIPGAYYTVNPVAIREDLNVLTENQRKLLTIRNHVFEEIAFVAIGALLVGSVNFTVQPHENVAKGDELGYFAYGGSTIVTVFKAGTVKWDDDLKHNSDNCMETLVRMGERIGQRTTDEERQEYLAYHTKFSKKNAAVSGLVNIFPTYQHDK